MKLGELLDGVDTLVSLPDVFVRVNDLLQQFDIGQVAHKQQPEPVDAVDTPSPVAARAPAKNAANAFDGNAALAENREWDEF